VTAMFDLSGLTAVVTGARRGIGLAMAEALALAGADIIGISAKLEPAGSDVERRVHAAGRRFTALTADLADRAAVRWLAENLNALGPIDILVNNAGTIARAPAADHPDEAWDHVIQVNLTSQFLLTREIGREMVSRGRGKIIFTASLLSFQGGINVPGYTAAKSGIAGLTKALANEWAPHGVNVNAIAPGPFRTRIGSGELPDERIEGIWADLIPLGRMAETDELKGLVLMLGSPAASFITGAVILIDGGAMPSSFREEASLA
jgi:2-dehydro-3-deoxy-D-gluconate 5-dehydrogenase